MSKPSRSEIAEQLAKRLGGRYLPNEAPLQVGMEKIWDALISASVELEELRARGDKRFHEGQSYLLHELLTNPKLIVDDNFRKALIENGWAPSGELRARQNGCGVEVATDAKTGKPDYCPLPKGHEGSHVLDLTGADAEVREHK